MCRLKIDLASFAKLYEQVVIEGGSVATLQSRMPNCCDSTIRRYVKLLCPVKKLRNNKRKVK